MGEVDVVRLPQIYILDFSLSVYLKALGFGLEGSHLVRLQCNISNKWTCLNSKTQNTNFSSYLHESLTMFCSPF